MGLTRPRGHRDIPLQHRSNFGPHTCIWLHVSVAQGMQIDLQTYIFRDDWSADEASTRQKSMRPGGTSPDVFCLYHVPSGVESLYRDDTSNTSTVSIGTFSSISLIPSIANRIDHAPDRRHHCQAAPLDEIVCPQSGPEYLFLQCHLYTASSPLLSADPRPLL